MKYKFLLALLFIAIISCGGQVLPVYDYLKLALQWPPSYCLTNNHSCRDQVPQYFTIDGFWPMRIKGKDSKQVVDCSVGLELTDDIIERYKVDLLKYWPNISTSDFVENKKMWKDQWKKHGTCVSAAHTMSTEQYFKTALDLTQQRILHRVLENADIRANGSSYEAKRILQAIKSATGIKVDLVCQTDIQGNVYLSEIHQCVSHAGDFFMDCKNVAKNCGKDPIFPA